MFCGLLRLRGCAWGCSQGRRLGRPCHRLCLLSYPSSTSVSVTSRPMELRNVEQVLWDLEHSECSGCCGDMVISSPSHCQAGLDGLPAGHHSGAQGQEIDDLRLVLTC